MKLALAAATLFWSLLCGLGCHRNAAIPDYEVLLVPRPPEQFQAGSTWTVGLGPVAPPAETVLTREAAGASSLTSTTSAANTARIEGAFKEWVSAALDMTKSRSLSITLTDVSHEVVTDAHALQESTPLLWEVVKVGAFTLTIDDTHNSSLTADMIGDEITRHLGGTVELGVTRTGSRTFDVRADQPVVAAIRVVNPNYRLNSASGIMPFDLSDAAVGEPQEVQFGYTLILQQPVDYPSRTATVWINNLASRQFTGGEVEFRGNEPWISPKRTAIPGADDELRDAQFVWDKISLVWRPRLSDCGVYVVRQYMTPRPIRSGLRGVR